MANFHVRNPSKKCYFNLHASLNKQKRNCGKISSAATGTNVETAQTLMKNSAKVNEGVMDLVYLRHHSVSLLIKN